MESSNECSSLVDSSTLSDDWVAEAWVASVFLDPPSLKPIFQGYDGRDGVHGWESVGSL